MNSSLRAERTTNVKAIVSEPITGLTGSCLRLPPFHFSNPGQYLGTEPLAYGDLRVSPPENFWNSICFFC